MGNGVPDTDNLKAMSKLFGISIDTLLDNESDIPLMVLYQEINIKEYEKRKRYNLDNIFSRRQRKREK